MSRTAIQAADHASLGQAYADHCDRCPTCRRGHTSCDTGAAILTAIATTRSDSDLPGYSTAGSDSAGSRRPTPAGRPLGEMKGWAATARDYERRAAAKQVRGE